MSTEIQPDKNEQANAEITNGPKPKSRGGPPAGSTNHRTHGHYERKKKLFAARIDDFSKRSSGGEQLYTRRAELVAHVGGTENLNAVTESVIERVCFTEYLLNHLDAYLAEQGPYIVDREQNTLLPAVLERNRMIDSLLKLYEKIGFTRAQGSLPKPYELTVTDETNG